MMDKLTHKLEKNYKALQKTKNYKEEVKYFADEIMISMEELDEELVVILAKKRNPLFFMIQILQEKQVNDILWSEMLAGNIN